MEETAKQILERKFDKSLIKKDYNGFDYIPMNLVIERLNEAFGQDGWDYRLDERIENSEAVIQFGAIGVKDESGEFRWKENCGDMSRRYAKGKEHILANQINIGDDYKGAVSNCLKRCAMMFGVALELYGESEKDAGDKRQEPEEEATRTEKAIAAIRGGEEALKNWGFDAMELRQEKLQGTSLGGLRDQNLENYAAWLRDLYRVERDKQRDAGTTSRDAS